MNTFRSHLMQQFVTAARSQSRPPLALIGLLSDETEAAAAAAAATTPTRFPNNTTSTRSRPTTSHSARTTTPHYPTSNTLPPSNNMSAALVAAVETVSPTPSTCTRGGAPSAHHRNILFPHDTEHLISSISLEESKDVAASNRSESSRIAGAHQPPLVISSSPNLTTTTTTTAAAYQHFLATRRIASSRFAVPSSSSLSLSSHNNVSPQRDSAYWKEAMDRAIQCGMTAAAAPNKKQRGRIKGVSFKRILTADSTTRLADIAYHVRLQRHHSRHRRPIDSNNKNNNNNCKTDASSSSSLSQQQQQQQQQQRQQQAALAAAERKRTKWLQVPAFLVTLLESSQRQDKQHSGDDDDDKSDESSSAADDDDDDENDNNIHDMYKPLAFVPPLDQNELEDYAAACTVVQTAMLSLHAEQIASKWIATTSSSSCSSSSRCSVVQTPAFRQLIQAQPNDRVVALLMVGEPLPLSNDDADAAMSMHRWSLEDMVEDI